METRELETLRLEIDGPHGRLILNRPERLNAIGPRMLENLLEAAHWFDSHRELRVVATSGAGRAFSAGADLRDVQVSQPHSWLNAVNHAK